MFNTSDSSRARILLVAVVVVSVFLVINGIFMLVKPMPWYQLVPGVSETGSFNPHFIRDIGLIQFLLGAAFLIGLFRPRLRIILWSGATIWLVAHAMLHFWEVAVGICSASAILRDFPAVTLPALIGIAASIWAWRTQKAVTPTS